MQRHRSFSCPSAAQDNAQSCERMWIKFVESIDFGQRELG